MNIKIVNNKYINAALLLMLASAMIHMAILFYAALAEGDFYLINYFRIIDINYFFPGFLQSFSGNVISVAVVVFIYVVILTVNKGE